MLVRSNAERGVYGVAPIDESVADRLETLTRPSEGDRMHQAPFGRVLEMRSVRLHNGGLFFTYTDATAQVKSEEGTRGGKRDAGASRARNAPKSW